MSAAYIHRTAVACLLQGLSPCARWDQHRPPLTQLTADTLPTNERIHSFMKRHITGLQTYAMNGCRDTHTCLHGGGCSGAAATALREPTEHKTSHYTAPMSIPSRLHSILLGEP